MSSTTVSVRINPAVKKRLEKLAKSTGRSRSFLAAEAKFVYGFAKSDQDNIRRTN